MRNEGVGEVGEAQGMRWTSFEFFALLLPGLRLLRDPLSSLARWRGRGEDLDDRSTVE
jgi:hypothetical protein